LQTKKC